MIYKDSNINRRCRKKRYNLSDTEYPSKMLKNSLGGFGAVVLKEKDLLILLREFHNAVTK